MKSFSFFLSILGFLLVSCSPVQPSFNMDYIVLNEGDSTLLEVNHVEQVRSIFSLHSQDSICELNDLGRRLGKHRIMVYGKNKGIDTIIIECHYVTGTSAHEYPFYIPIEVIE